MFRTIKGNQIVVFVQLFLIPVRDNNNLGGDRCRVNGKIWMLLFHCSMNPRYLKNSSTSKFHSRSYPRHVTPRPPGDPVSALRVPESVAHRRSSQRNGTRYNANKKPATYPHNFTVSSWGIIVVTSTNYYHFHTYFLFIETSKYTSIYQSLLYI